MNETMSKVRSLKMAEWPVIDQQCWNAACRPNGRLTRGGTAFHLRPITRADLERRYGAFLGHIARRWGLDSGAAKAAAWVTPECVNTYLSELEHRVSSVTKHGVIAKLRCMCQILAPLTDFKWLQEIENDLAMDMVPATKFDRIVGSEVIYHAGLTLMEEASRADNKTQRQRAVTYRNGLMIALLALCPIRLKNFCSLVIDKNFMRIGDDWCIALSANETKERRADERPIPVFLSQRIDTYLASYRSIFGYLGNELWVGLYGNPVSYSGVERIITETTRQTLGHPISPHLFRTCGASTASMFGTSHGNLASALLNHRDPKITQRHYNRSRSVHYSTRFQELIEPKL
jgi:integrase/recombinase XerD